MLWAALVAGGVAIVSMAIFAARLTRKPVDDPHDDLVLPPSEIDPEDPWAAWEPRPFEDHERPPRPRFWPVLAALTGLVLVGGGLAGSRYSPSQPQAAAADMAPEPYLIEVKVSPTPTPPPTPTPAATAKPAAKTQVAAPAAPPTGPLVTGSATCKGLQASVSFKVEGRGATLSYVGVYLDKKVVGGGPIASQTYQGTVQRTTTAGPHELEVSAQDTAGKTSRRQWRVTCA